MIDKSRLSIATMTFVRSAEEDHLLRESLEALAKYQVPVYITDGGSPPEFLDFLKQFPLFTVAKSPKGGVFAQVANSLRIAYNEGRQYVLYTEPDKKFFFSELDQFLDTAEMTDGTGLFLASRSEEGWASYPAFQQMTETCANNCLSELTGVALDYTYGPFLLQRELIPYLDLVTEDIGWGWRLYVMGIVQRLGLRLNEFRGAYLCPPEQREDKHTERVYRMRQLEQGLRGMVLSHSIRI